MKYMLLIYGNEDTWNALYGDAFDEHLRAHRDLVDDLVASGEYIDGQGLTTLGAKTVRVHGDAPTVTDGPFTEAKEVLAGYYLVDCADTARAADIAARLPEARLDLVEVRRVIDPFAYGASDTLRPRSSDQADIPDHGS